MTSATGDDQAYGHLIGLIRIARALEAGGIYNAAKLCWAEAYSQELRAATAQPIAPEALDAEIEAAIGALEAACVNPALLAALRRGRQAAQENRTIPRSEIPEVAVCRDCGEILLGPLPAQCPTCGARSVTFREFPPVYYLEPLAPERVVELLAAAPGELEGITHGLTDEQMALRPRPGAWAIGNVLLHLLVAQELLAGRVERILNEENPSLHAKAAWMVGDEETMPARDLLKRFGASREATVARLRPLHLEQWFRTGEHQEFGRVTLLQQASYFTKHERHHMPRIEAARRTVETRAGTAIP